MQCLLPTCSMLTAWETFYRLKCSQLISWLVWHQFTIFNSFNNILNKNSEFWVPINRKQSLWQIYKIKECVLNLYLQNSFYTIFLFFELHLQKWTDSYKNWNETETTSFILNVFIGQVFQLPFLSQLSKIPVRYIFNNHTTLMTWNNTEYDSIPSVYYTSTEQFKAWIRFTVHKQKHFYWSSSDTTRLPLIQHRELQLQPTSRLQSHQSEKSTSRTDREWLWNLQTQRPNNSFFVVSGSPTTALRML